MSRRPQPPPLPPKDMRAFFVLTDNQTGARYDAARFPDGRVVVATAMGSFYPHASMADAQRVHIGCSWEKVK